MERTQLGWCSCRSTCCWHAACCSSPWVRPAQANHISTPVPSCIEQLSTSEMLIMLLQELPILDQVMFPKPGSVSGKQAPWQRNFWHALLVVLSSAGALRQLVSCEALLDAWRSVGHLGSRFFGMLC